MNDQLFCKTSILDKSGSLYFYSVLIDEFLKNLRIVALATFSD